jgi:hypothetical protein
VTGARRRAAGSDIRAAASAERQGMEATRSERPRLSGAALIVGAVVLWLLVGPAGLDFWWFPLITGLALLVAAAVGRRRSALWAPGCVLTAVGLTVVVWTEAGRRYDFQFLALVAIALGTGGLIAAALARWLDLRIGPESVALPVLGFGLFALLEQQAAGPFAGDVRPYAALLALAGLLELRPRRPAGG